MPSKPMKPCIVPMCRNLTAETYCTEHAHVRKQKNRIYDEYVRCKKARQFYKCSEWEKVRQQVLTRDYGLCQDCLSRQRIIPADVVDHIKPLRLFWELRTELSNLRSLCHACHNRKTAEEKRKI